MKKIFTITLLFIVVLFSAEANGIIIVENGIPKAEIITGEKPTRAVQFAAYELRHVIKLMTGAELPIVKKATGKFPIILGGAKKGEFKREAYSVSVTPEQIVLKGNDSPDFGKVDYKNQNTYPKPEFNYHSTLYAVYDFLEYCAGVRFYGRGDLGIGMKKRKTLEVKPFEWKYAPAEEGMRYVHSNDRLYQLRMRCNKLYGYINHNAFSLGYRYWGKTRHKPNAFVEKRPEYFAKYKRTKMVDVNVKRLYLDQNDPVPAQMCMSNPDIIPHFADEAFALYKGKPQPGTHIVFPRMEDCPFIYPFGEQDGANWCECDTCESRFPQVEKRFRFNYIHYDFANKLFREMKKRDPNMGLIIFAYHQHLRYPDPKIVKLDPGIAVCMVIQRDEWSPKGETYRWQSQAYNDWIRKERKNRYLYTWEHYINPAERAMRVYKYKFFPHFSPKDTAAFYKQHVKNGMQGCFLQIHYDINILEAYLIMRTIWDPNYDTEKVIDEYYNMMYAEAAAPMKTFFTEMEKIVLNPRNYPKTKQKLHTQSVNWALGTPERIKRLDGYIKQAQKQVKDPDAKIRVEAFVNTVWKQTLEGRKDFDKRLSLEKLPPPSTGIAVIGSKEIPSERDWQFTVGTDLWMKNNTAEKLTAADSPKIKMISNGKDLFIRFEEKSSFGWQNRNANMWFNNVEMFFAKQTDRPYYQIAVSTKGESYAGYSIERDGQVIHTDHIFPVKVLKNELKQDSWVFTIQIPMKEIGLTPGAEFYGNFIRTRRIQNGTTSKAENVSWSNVIPNVPYSDSIYRMGRIHLPGIAGKEPELNGNFKKVDKKGMPVFWRQSLPAIAKAGQLAKAENGVLKINAVNQEVQLICLKDFNVKYGAKLSVSFKAWGKGKIRIRTSFYAPEHAKSIRLRGRKDSVSVEVSEKPQVKTVELVLTGNLRWRDIYTALPSICAEKGAVINISDLKIKVLEK